MKGPGFSTPRFGRYPVLFALTLLLSAPLRVNAFSFGPPEYFTCGDDPRGIVAADFDGDGNLDIAVVNAPSNTISILLGDGAGGFAAPVTLATGFKPLGIAVADFNQDGDPDLATADSLSNTASIRFGGAGATFGPRLAYGVAPGPLAIGIGPGYWEVAPGIVTTSANGQTTHYEGDGSGALFWRTTGNGGAHALGVAGLDFDHDSDEDLVVANADPSADPGKITLLRTYYDQYDRVWYYTNSEIAAPAAPQAVTAVDLDGGSWADLIAASAGSAGGMLSIWQGDGQTPYHSRRDIPVDERLTTVVQGDLDDDALPDVVAAGPTGMIALFRNDLGTVNFDQAILLGERVSGVALGDFDLDGMGDVAVTLPASGRAALLRSGAVSGSPEASSPRVASFLSAAPNPARSRVTITLGAIPGGSSTIDVRDVGGRLVRELVAAISQGNTSRAVWDLLDGDGNHVAAGIYFITRRGDRITPSARVTVIP